MGNVTGVNQNSTIARRDEKAAPLIATDAAKDLAKSLGMKTPETFKPDQGLIQQAKNYF